jgi:cytochrome P450
MLSNPPLVPPIPGSQEGRLALKALLRGGVLSALEAMHAAMGDVFRIPLPGFSPVVLVGPEANHFVTVSGRNDLRWRSERDPVTGLLRQGLLVTDGQLHDDLRRKVSPPLHKGLLASYLSSMLAHTDRVSTDWPQARPVDMLVEMRKLALAILTDTLYQVDIYPVLKRLWPDILRTLAYISPGLWVIWPGVPRPGYNGALQRLDGYLYQIIGERKAASGGSNDLLGGLIHSGMDDDLIRDQLLTILIAGHDTSTALLAWTLYLLGSHPVILQQVRAEVDQTLGSDIPDMERLGRMSYMEQVIDEALRLYPPIHIGNRIAATDLEFQGYHIRAGTRVVYSIYLSHRHPQYWPDPQRFDPERFATGQAALRPHYAYVPFGGGPRNCIGMAFARLEAKAILARLLQTFDLELVEKRVHAHMGATLEPRPGVKMKVTRRSGKK